MKYLIAGLLLFASSLALAADTGIELVKKSMAKVVMIEVSGVVDSYESDESTVPAKITVRWFGSGALISKDGYILSCDHLFTRKLEDRRIIVKMHDGKKYLGMLLSEDYKKDLSLIKIFNRAPRPYFVVGSTPPVRGQRVWAFGSPLAYSKTVSTGFIQNLEVGKDKRTMHSAGLNPGNSGGPLVSEDGKLVGVNVSILLVNPFMRAEGMGQSTSLTDIQKFLKE